MRRVTISIFAIVSALLLMPTTTWSQATSEKRIKIKKETPIVVLPKYAPRDTVTIVRVDSIFAAPDTVFRAMAASSDERVDTTNTYVPIPLPLVFWWHNTKTEKAASISYPTPVIWEGVVIEYSPVTVQQFNAWYSVYSPVFNVTNSYVTSTTSIWNTTNISTTNVNTTNSVTNITNVEWKHGHHDENVTATPEPSTLVLVFTALVVLSAIAVVKRRSTQPYNL